jgi:hypothetical protein
MNEFIEQYIELCKKHGLMIRATIDGEYYVSDIKPKPTYDLFKEQVEELNEYVNGK